MSKQIKANLKRVGQRTGSPRERVRPSGVAQYGQAQGSHAMRVGDTGYRGINAMAGKPGTPSRMGNEVAATTVCGPGGSRTVMKSGSQGRQAEPHSESAEAKRYAGAGRAMPEESRASEMREHFGRK